MVNRARGGQRYGQPHPSGVAGIPDPAPDELELMNDPRSGRHVNLQLLVAGQSRKQLGQGQGDCAGQEQLGQKSPPGPRLGLAGPGGSVSAGWGRLCRRGGREFSGRHEGLVRQCWTPVRRQAVALRCWLVALVLRHQRGVAVGPTPFSFARAGRTRASFRGQPR